MYYDIILNLLEKPLRIVTYLHNDSVCFHEKKVISHFEHSLLINQLMNFLHLLHKSYLP